MIPLVIETERKKNKEGMGFLRTDNFCQQYIVTYLTKKLDLWRKLVLKDWVEAALKLPALNFGNSNENDNSIHLISFAIDSLVQSIQRETILRGVPKRNLFFYFILFFIFYLFFSFSFFLLFIFFLLFVYLFFILYIFIYVLFLIQQKIELKTILKVLHPSEYMPVFILRFINPAITSPIKFNIVHGEFEEYQLKNLLGFGRVLQFIANSTAKNPKISPKLEEYIRICCQSNILNSIFTEFLKAEITTSPFTRNFK